MMLTNSETLGVVMSLARLETRLHSVRQKCLLPPACPVPEMRMWAVF